jgi:DNA-binding NarL/FixJ family response regulator
MHKIILADNQAIFRAGIAKVLAVEDDMRIVAQAQTVEQMMGALETFHASLMIFAGGLLPRLDVLTAAAVRMETALIVIAENGEPSAPFLEAGVRGVVYRSISGDELLRAVQSVAAGKSYIQDTKSQPPAVESEDLVGARVRDRLTPKELKIVALIVQGYKNKEIASQLGTTEQVIKNYLRNIYDKIGVSDRLELALFTIHHRILAEAAAAVTGERLPSA